jgi:hypothetical protein
MRYRWTIMDHASWSTPRRAGSARHARPPQRARGHAFHLYTVLSVVGILFVLAIVILALLAPRALRPSFGPADNARSNSNVQTLVTP